MSCTENESGPFGKFFFPAVVGCITVVLARRWTNSQASNTASTAFTRRRKIIKDPPVKRPIPPISCKMVSQGSKRTGAANKKGAHGPVAPEEGGNKIKTIIAPSKIFPGATKIVAQLVPTKHIPLPYIPQDGELLFEIMSFIFLLTAMGLQFLNMYRTMWWLPHSFTTQAMNFHLIDPHLVAFIVAIISRRLLLSIILLILKSILAEKLMPHATVAARMFVLGVILGAMSWCTYFLILKYSFVKIFYLCYPAVIYFLLFGTDPIPFLELHNVQPIMHNCTNDLEQIREEVEVLRLDFNIRIRKIVFNSIFGAYYTSFVPCCFAQPFLHYDAASAAQQVGLVWGALCGRYSAQLLAASLVDTPHRAARHLGRWLLLPSSPPPNIPGWRADMWYPYRAQVRVEDMLFVADSRAVAAAPNDVHHFRFHTVFGNPSKLLCLFLCLQLSLVAMQLCLLFSTFAWHNYLSIVILLFINYYTIFKMIRDYFVAWKVYKAEELIQGKTITQNLAH